MSEGGNGRDAKGRVQAGNSLRSGARKTKAAFISRKLRKEYERRYSGMPLNPDDPTSEVYGPERARLRHYFVCMDVMDNAAEAAKDRLKAAEILANRMDGKPVDEVDITGTLETKGPLDKAIGQMTSEELLELVRAARGH